MEATTDKAAVNKFNKGDIVFERVNPGQKLTVSRYENKLYYCSLEGQPNRKDLVFHERDLMTEKVIKG